MKLHVWYCPQTDNVILGRSHRSNPWSTVIYDRGSKQEFYYIGPL